MRDPFRAGEQDLSTARIAAPPCAWLGIGFEVRSASCAALPSSQPSGLRILAQWIALGDCLGQSLPPAHLRVAAFSTTAQVAGSRLVTRCPAGFARRPLLLSCCMLHPPVQVSCWLHGYCRHEGAAHSVRQSLRREATDRDPPATMLAAMPRGQLLRAGIHREAGAPRNILCL